jgi:hypothetical protein
MDARGVRGQPVLVVLEDMQWGDAGTVGLLDGAIRSLRDHPFMVLALARPDLQTVFPNLWAERQVHVIQLPPLSRRASERLVREALGASVATRWWRRSSARRRQSLLSGGIGSRRACRTLGRDPRTHSGHRAGAAGSRGPRRQARAARGLGVRRNLLARWRGGAARRRALGVGEALERLTDRELVNLAASSIASDGSPAFTFAHALIREAAYAMLTDEDRSLGHRLAAKWLLEHSAPEPFVLAEHFRRGGDARSASFWYRRAAEQALKANDLDGAIARAGLGLAALGSVAARRAGGRDPRRAFSGPSRGLALARRARRAPNRPAWPRWPCLCRARPCGFAPPARPSWPWAARAR